MANKDSISNQITNYFDVIDEQLKAARAICDAAAVLIALERAPSHHDTHPSHNILTGGGYAHGLKVGNETLPILLKQAANLIDMAHNDAGCMREEAIEALTSKANLKSI